MNDETSSQISTVSHGTDAICCHRTETAPEARKEARSFGAWIVAVAFVAGVMLGGATIYAVQFKIFDHSILPSTTTASADLTNIVIPDQGITLPVVWNDTGKRLVDSGVIDQKKFENLYAQRGGLDEQTKKLLIGNDNGRLVITNGNANAMLNLLWALGLANKNAILENGQMTAKQFGGDPSKFASMAGWTLAAGKTMDHYSNHSFFLLTPDQQTIVEKVSKNIYRPCCGNSTYFPDCNHGMAMLGLLELMAFQGVSEQNMYRAALAANSYWFPDTYLTLAQYFQSKGIAWEKVGAQEILGPNFSSASGYQKILSQVRSIGNGKGASCGV